MKISVVPRKWFMDRKDTKEEKTIFDTCNIISIITPVYDPKNFAEEDIPFSEKYRENSNVIILKFHDYYKEGEDIVLMSDDDALKIKNFYDAMDKSKQLIVHCTAGKSRSYTVASVLNIIANRIDDDNQQDYHIFCETYNKNCFTNLWVKDKMLNVFGLK